MGAVSYETAKEVWLELLKLQQLEKKEEEIVTHLENALLDAYTEGKRDYINEGG